MDYRLILWAVLLLAATAQGCSAFKKQALPPMPILPEKIAAAPDVTDLTMTATLLELVKDRRAKILVAEALENNHDLKATALRLKSAGLLLSQTRAARLPEISAEYSDSRDNQSLNRDVQNNHQILLSLAWEIDIWGKLADLHTAGEKDFRSREQTYCRAMDSLAARVLQTWFRVRSNKMRLDIYDKRVEIFRHIEDTVLTKYKAGLGNLHDITTARSKTNLARSNRTMARDIYDASIRDLELLLGRYPNADLEVENSLPEVALTRPEAPASILANRPDVQAALEKAQSALSEAKAGHKELLPSITLTGNIFRDNEKLGGLGSSENAWDLVGSILFPLFNAGRIKDEAAAADAKAEAAYKDLAGIVLQAMKEAEDAFSKETRLKERLGFLEKALDDARQSRDYYEARFKQGLASIIELHMARDQELDLLSDILDVKASRIVNRVDMALAVGTGVYERKKDETF